MRNSNFGSLQIVFCVFHPFVRHVRLCAKIPPKKSRKQNKSISITSRTMHVSVHFRVCGIQIDYLIDLSKVYKTTLRNFEWMMANKKRMEKSKIWRNLVLVKFDKYFSRHITHHTGILWYGLACKLVIRILYARQLGRTIINRNVKHCTTRFRYFGSVTFGFVCYIWPGDQIYIETEKHLARFRVIFICCPSRVNSFGPNRVLLDFLKVKHHGFDYKWKQSNGQRTPIKNQIALII